MDFVPNVEGTKLNVENELVVTEVVGLVGKEEFHGPKSSGTNDHVARTCEKVDEVCEKVVEDFKKAFNEVH